MIPFKKSYNEYSGFSLLELIAVITILAIVVAITITRIAESSDTAREKSCFHNRAMINSAFERFSVENSTAPTAISDVDTIDYFPNGIPTCPLTGNAYTLNATTLRVEGHTSSGANPGDH